MPNSARSRQALRVLLVSPDYPPARGGIQTLLHRITTALPDAETRVLTMRNPGWEEFDSTSSQVIRRLPSIGSGVARSAVFNVTAAIAASKWRPDVILNGHVVVGPVSVMLARRFRSAHVMYAYGKEISGHPKLTAWTMRNSSAGIAISEFTRSQVLDTFRKDESTPIKVITPGVDIPAVAGRADAVRPTIVTIARLRDWYKGHDVVMEALPQIRASFPDVEWAIIGSGRIQPDLERRAAELGLSSNVRFVGSVSDEERDEWLSRAHVFTMPSRYPKDEVGGEGFAIVFLEAAAWGLPTVGPNVGAPKEAVADGETGLLVNPESPAEVASALIRILGNPTYARALGSAGRQRAFGDFTWEAVGAQLKEALQTATLHHTIGNAIP